MWGTSACGLSESFEVGPRRTSSESLCGSASRWARSSSASPASSSAVGSGREPLPGLPTRSSSVSSSGQAPRSWVWLPPPQEIPSSEGASTTLEALTAITGSYRRLDDCTASLELLPLAFGHLAHVSNVAQRSRSAAERRSLWAAASEAAGLAGGLAFDAGGHAQARSHYRTAITFAERAGNPLLQAFSLGMMSSFRAETAQGAKAVQLIERGRSLLPREVPPTIQARMATYEANAYSSVGDAPHALSALGRADTAGEQIQADGEMFWPLVFPFDAGRRARERGACATRLKESQIALTALEEGLEALGSGASKRRALVLSDLAESYVLIREIEEACRLLGEAFDVGVQLRSDRVLTRVRQVRRELAPWKDMHAVRELEERLVGGFLGNF